MYCGSSQLVESFLSGDGLKVSDVNSVIVAGPGPEVTGQAKGAGQGVGARLR